MRVGTIASVILLSAATAASPAYAQDFHLGLAGGGVFPVGKLDSSYTAGRSGLVSLSIGSEDAVIGVRLDYQYDEFKGKTLNGNTIPDFHVNSTTLNIVAPFRVGYAKPYIIGGFGRYPLNIPGTKKETDWGGNIGGGIAFPIPGTTIGGFVEARYHDVNRSNTSPYHFVPVTLGVQF